MLEARERLKLPCGCEWDVVRKNGEIVAVDYNPLQAPLNCPKTWDMLCKGKTLGTFQLETRLGQIFAKKLKPTNIEELADLISIIRPGTLDAILDEKSLTHHFIDRKHRREPVEYPHELLESVTRDSYGIMISQEQSMLAAQLVAKFTGPESYTLIKAIGKKKPELMAQLKSRFIDGAVSNGVKQEDAEQIFSIIEASQRYSFNRCLSLDTQVNTPRGRRTLDELEIGELVDGPEGWLLVTNKFYSRQELFDVHFDALHNIRCSMDHKFKTHTGDVVPLKEIIEKNLRVTFRQDQYAGLVREFKSAGVQDSVDIEVDCPDHIFYGNDLATSNSHGISYALDNYIFSAYPKAHFPKAFFTAQLDAAKTFKDVNDFVTDAMENDVCVVGPDLRSKNRHFLIEKNCIRYGLTKIKHVSDNVVSQLEKISDFSWENLLYNFLPFINAQAAEALIKSGSLDMSRKSRKSMHYEYKIFKRLSIAQRKLINKSLPLRDNIVKMIAETTREKTRTILESRLQELDTPPYSLEDSVSQICRWEQELLGYSFTYTELDDRNLSISNCTCEEFLQGNFNKSNVVRIAVVLESIRDHKIKKKGAMEGETMAFACGSDKSGKISSIIFFPNTYYDYNTLVFPGNRVVIQGKQGNKDSSFIVERVYQL